MQVIRDDQVLRVNQDLVDPLDLREKEVSEDLVDFPDVMVAQVNAENGAQMVPRDHRVSQVT